MKSLLKYWRRTMAKRFTDNEKWKDAWFMDLPSKYKLFWIYLLDECDHSGIWKVNFKVATFYIGEHLEYSEVKRILSDRILILNDKYWHIKKFIEFQYNSDISSLNAKNKVHLSVLKKLNSYDEFKPLTSPLLGAKDKDKEKEKDKFNDKDDNFEEKTDYSKPPTNPDLNNLNISELSKYMLNSDEHLKTFEYFYPEKEYKQCLIDFYNHKMKSGSLTDSFNNYSRHFFNWIKLQQ